ncbi:MAG: hypothetical protein ACHQ53_08030 [Polyangiales bacterium]
MSKPRTTTWVAVALLAGCYGQHTGAGSSGGQGGHGGSKSDASVASSSKGQPGKLPQDGPACVVSETTATIAATNNDRVDMLFMIDNSDSMADKQTLLRAQLPHLITVLTTGDLDGDGRNDFPPAKDLHLGVVTSDMGLPGVDGIQNCKGLGQDGVLQHQPNAQLAGCQASYPPFLSFTAGVNQPAQTAQDFGCIAQVGTGGCGFEHPLEAVLKALWPSVDPMAANNGGMNRITFLADPTTGRGTLGHGDTDNADFVRNDPVAGLSLISVILLTDEDDCSSANTQPFTPPQFLDPNDPLVMQGMVVRCHFNQQALFPVERYINGLKALRPGNENLVSFAAIAGVPADLVGPDALTNVDLANPADHDRFYKNILGDPRMEEFINNQGTTDPSDDRLLHACVIDASAAAASQSQVGAADPARRIVQVAAGFGENGIVQSICQKDYGPALDQIVKVIAKQLGAACLPRTLARNTDGLVDCNVVWELPPPGTAPASTPVACHARGFEFLLDPDQGGATLSDRGGAICRVAQLAVKDEGGGSMGYVPTMTDGVTYSDGWFYDDFSDETKRGCTGTAKQRIAFTAGAKPPFGVTPKLQCVEQLLASVAGPANGASCSAGSQSANAKHVGSHCEPDAVPDQGFDDRQAYVGTSDAECGGGACLVYRLRGDPRASCDPALVAGTCADATEVQERVYCSCRCDAPDGYAACACPSGFTCLEAVGQGSADVRGGYCVKNGTFAP